MHVILEQIIFTGSRETMSESQKPASTRGTDITSGIFSLVVLIFFLPKIIEFAKAWPTDWVGPFVVLILNISTTCLLVTRPLTNLLNISAAGAVPALTLFKQAMPDAEVWLNANAGVGNISTYMTSNALFIYVLILPVFLLIWGAIRAGTYAKKDESGVGVGLRFAAKLTLGGFAGYAIVWGLLGAFTGTWNNTLGAPNAWQAPFIIFWLLLVNSWKDLVLIFILGAIFGAVGKAIGKKQAEKKAKQSVET